MDINMVKQKYAELNAELKQALSGMARTDRVFVVRDQIKELQSLCPHNNGNYDFSDTDACPYCGKHFKG